MKYRVNLELIRAKRLEQGLTLEDMAKTLDFQSRTKYFRRETGECRFRADEIPEVAEILKIPLKKIFIKN